MRPYRVPSTWYRVGPAAEGSLVVMSKSFGARSVQNRVWLRPCYIFMRIALFDDYPFR
jgi:hypothetical protein